MDHRLAALHSTRQPPGRNWGCNPSRRTPRRTSTGSSPSPSPPAPGLSSIASRFKAADELLFVFDGQTGQDDHALAFETYALPLLEPLPAGCLPKVTKIGWQGWVHINGVTFKLAAQLLRICPNLRGFGRPLVCSPDPAAQINLADPMPPLASDKLEDLQVKQQPQAGAAAASGNGGGAAGGADGGAAAALNWLARLPNLRRLACEAAGREALITALTALTYLHVDFVGRQAHEAPLPLGSCPALRELSFKGYDDFDQVLPHLGNCSPLAGLTCLHLCNE